MSWANFAMAMKLGSMMGSVLGEATQNKYLKAASQAFAGFGAAAGGAATMETLHSGATTANTTTPSPKPVAPKGDPGGIKKGISPGGIKKGIGPAPGTQPKADLLKVKPGGYTKTGLQEAYLKGLEQSGAKLDNKGQIVKQSGQPFKTEGWDRKAQLMGGRRTPDRLHRLRMLAIDKAADAKGTKAVTTEIGSNIPQTKDEAEVRKIWSLDGKSEDELNELGKRLGVTDYSNWDLFR